jgi:hypothetical protein
MTNGVITTVEKPLFVKKTHELTPLLKRIQAGSAQAVDLLIDTMNRPDDEVGIKLKVQCAEALVDMEVKISDQISKDQLTRQIAEIKAKGFSQPLDQLPGEPRRLPPKTDYSTIQEV